MGERSAVRPKSGQSVSQSDPGLRRPTPPSTAGRKPAARPPVLLPPATDFTDESTAREAGLPQPKIGRGAGQSPAELPQRAALGIQDEDVESIDAALDNLSESEIAILADFFLTLDRWDREAHGKSSM